MVLGGDTPSGLPLISELEKNGYVVITSVSTPEHVDEIELQTHGYVRALVLDPTEVGHSRPSYSQALTMHMRLAKHYPVLPALSGIHAVAPLSHDRFRGPAFITVKPFIHPFRDLLANSPNT